MSQTQNVESEDQEIADTEQEEKPEKPSDKALIKAYIEDKQDELEEERKELEMSPDHTIIKRKKYGNHSAPF